MRSATLRAVWMLFPGWNVVSQRSCWCTLHPLWNKASDCDCLSTKLFSLLIHINYLARNYMPVSAYIMGVGKACRDEGAILSTERWGGGELVADKVISVLLSGLGESEFSLTDTHLHKHHPPESRSCPQLVADVYQRASNSNIRSARSCLPNKICLAVSNVSPAQRLDYYCK